MIFFDAAYPIKKKKNVKKIYMQSYPYIFMS